MKSDNVKKGIQRAPHRSLLRACGLNDEDFEKSRGMCLKTTEYTTEEAVFFAANDTDGDGVLDVIDYFNISNMRFGN